MNTIAQSLERIAASHEKIGRLADCGVAVFVILFIFFLLSLLLGFG